MLRMTLCAAVLAAALATAGCGGDSGRATPVAVTVSDTGYEMPKRVEGGMVAMRFRNQGTQLHEFALARVDDGHTAEEVEATVATSVGSGDPPTWLSDVAGPGLLTPGDEITVTRRLDPGVYVFIDGVPDSRGVPGSARGITAVFTVTGNSKATAPATDGVIVARENGYAVPVLAAGTRTIELRNSSSAPRGFLLTTLEPGKTGADAERWAGQIDQTGRLPTTQPPFKVLGAMRTIPAGTSVYVTIELEAGRTYRLSDDESGISKAFTPR